MTHTRLTPSLTTHVLLQSSCEGKLSRIVHILEKKHVTQVICFSCEIKSDELKSLPVLPAVFKEERQITSTCVIDTSVICLC